MLFSLVPFVALLISVLELVLPEATQESVVSWLVGAASLPAGLADSVDAAIEDAGPPATIAGAVALWQGCSGGERDDVLRAFGLSGHLGQRG